MMTQMELQVRPATAADAADGLLYESARDAYDAYAGGEARARRLLARAYGERGNAASFEVCRVALAGGRLAGVMAGFPVEEGDRLARRFVALTLPRLPPWRWPGLLAHLRAAGLVCPTAPAGSWYVDALAVDPAWRRRGVAGALLAAAAREAVRTGATGVSLDTGVANAGARALYEAHGFRAGEVRHAPSARVARAVGGPGFVAYFKTAPSASATRAT
jgi:ribosomal protein S18 acetylase RimI-like enzyme